MRRLAERVDVELCRLVERAESNAAGLSDLRVASIESVSGRLHAFSERSPPRWVKRLLRV